MWSYQHHGFTVHQLPALRDNYIYLIESMQSDLLIAIDPAEAVSVRLACEQLNKPLTHIFNTHHHWDHTDGNLPLQASFGCQIIGAAHDQARIPGIDLAVDASHPPDLGHLPTTILELPGHTSGHIALLIDDALFCGDTLFGAGCGRLFEGSFEEMWVSLNRLARLEPQTKVYCAHEYTLPNLQFARTVDPDNEALQQRLIDDKATRRRHQPTIPSTIALELTTNPFLRPRDQGFCYAYASAHGVEPEPLAVFTDIRIRKDRHR